MYAREANEGVEISEEREDAGIYVEILKQWKSAEMWKISSIKIVFCKKNMYMHLNFFFHFLRKVWLKNLGTSKNFSGMRALN